MKLLLLLLLFSPLTVSSAPECVCIKDPHPSEEKLKADQRQAYEKATAVFAGKVIALDAYTVTFGLERRWKGKYSLSEVVLSTGAVPGYDGTPFPEECSYQFHLGEEYLVYAYGAPERMKANTCATLVSKDAVKEEKRLDAIKLHETIRRNP
jgi:hypothetical protein